MSKSYLDYILSFIEGNEGIVNKMSNYVKNGREIQKSISDKTTVLDDLAKIFCMCGIEYPSYTSVIQNANYPDNLHIIWPGIPPKMGLDANKVKTLKTILQQSPIDYNNLFQHMYKYYNPIIHFMLEDLKNEKQKQLRSINKKHSAYDSIKAEYDSLDAMIKVSYIKSRINYNFKSDNNSIFKEFVNLNKYKIIKEVNSEKIKELSKKNFEVIKHDSQNSAHQNVHVEVKGLYELRSEDEESKEFNIGLARAKGGEPGSCAGCTAELKAIEDIKHLVLNRTADYPYNFPPVNYTASYNVKNDEKVLAKFINNIVKACKDNLDVIPK